MNPSKLPRYLWGLKLQRKPKHQFSLSRNHSKPFTYGALTLLLSLFTFTSLSAQCPVSDCEIDHTTTINVDNINGCLTTDITGDIEQNQSDCRDEQNTLGSCHKFIINRAPGSTVTGVSFDFGQGAGCNGDVDAGYAFINGVCTDLGTGGSQSATSFLGFGGGNQIELTICKSSSSFFSLCGLCSCELMPSCNATPVTCEGPGSITATANGASGTVTYTLMPGGITNTTGIFNNLSAGTYTVKAVDENNCEGSCSATVENQVPPNGCCELDADCNLADINSTGCTIPSAFNDPDDVFNNIEDCGNTLLMALSETGDKVFCTDNDGVDFTRTYTLYLDNDGSNSLNAGDEIVETCVQDIIITPPAVVVSCPNSGNTISACATQQQINDAFDAWIDGFSIDNPGCGITSSTDLSQYSAPLRCSATNQSVTINFSATDGCSSDNCSATFTVTAAPQVDVSCPTTGNTINGCATQDEINEAFDTWIDGFVINNTGCGITSSTDLSQYSAPLRCSETNQSVTVNFSATDGCSSDNCSATFTVTAAPQVAVSCPTTGNTISACATQQQINDAFDAWIDGFTIDNPGCGIKSSTDLSQYSAPLRCSETDQSVTINFTATNGCSSDNCSATFTVTAAPQVDVSCPTAGNTINACATQQQINDAFDAWIDGFVINNPGCGITSSTDLSQYSAPLRCSETNQSVTINFTATDGCSSDNCSATFTVTAAPQVDVSCPTTGNTISACATQQQINDAFDAWIDGFVINNPGCGITSSTDLSQYSAPDRCSATDQTVTINFSATDGCSSDNCSATFTVTAAPQVDVSCPTTGNTISACATQDEINEAFDAWIDGFVINNTGCGITSSTDLSQYSAPDRCSATNQTVTINFSATDGCSSDNCSATFTVTAAPQVDVSCPTTGNTISACATQDEINEAFDAWIDGFVINNPGCGITSSTDLSQYSAPSSCSFTDQTVTINFSATDGCSSDNCSATFTVTAAPVVSVSCPTTGNTISACATQDEIDDAFDAWIDGFTIDNPGCGIKSSTDLSQYSAPLRCSETDQTVTINFTATNGCSSDNCSATFTVTAAPQVDVSCPTTGNTISACATQDEIDEAFDAWIDGFVINNPGCGITSSTDLSQYSAPDRCSATNQSVTINFTATDGCSSDNCSATFTVTAAPQVDVSCPTTGNTISACATQDEIDEAFDAWIDGFVINNTGCGITSSTDLSQYSAPDRCSATNQTVTINFSATDGCSSDNCSATFTVTAAPQVDVSCPTTGNTISACATQDEIDEAFDAWIDGFVINNPGCGITSSTDLSQYSAPSSCSFTDQTVTINFSATDGCSSDNCSATFTVTAAPVVSVSCPTTGNTISACATQDEIDEAFDAWIDGFVINNPGCGIKSSTDLSQYSAPLRCSETNQSVTINFTATNGCSSDNCSATFTVTAAPQVDVSCPTTGNTISACATQDEIDEAFDAWIDGFVINNPGCGITSSTDLSQYSAPDRCSATNQSVTINFTATDGCSSDNCSATFTVTAAPQVDVSCPTTGNTISACATQDEIDEAFDAWIDGFVINNPGCGITSSTDLSQYSAPDRCSATDQTVTINFSATDGCSSDNCSATFTVTAAPQVDVSCPTTGNTISACATQDEINEAFDAWIDGFVINNTGCGITSSTDLSQYSAPDRCSATDQTVTINFSATDGCSSDNCSATFTVTAAPQVDVSCPTTGNTISACATQDEIDEAFDAWIDGFVINNPGCGITSSTDLSQYSAPDRCSATNQTVTINFSATDGCSSDNCSATFTVLGEEPLSVSCPTDPNLGACSSQGEIEAAYAIWKAGFEVLNGCSPNSNIDQIPDLPDYVCGAAINLSFTLEATGACTTKSCPSTFTVAPTTPPTIDKEAESKMVECDGSGNLDELNTWLADNGGAEASDDCGPVRWENDFNGLSDECGETGSVTVTFTAYDNCDLYAQTTATFTIKDTKKPELIGVPESIPNISCDDPLPPQATVTATDMCSGDLPVTATVDPYQVDVCNGYSITYRWKATDDCGLTTEVTRTFQVLPDTEAPMIESKNPNIYEGATIYESCNNADPNWDPFNMNPDDFMVTDDCSDVEVSFDDILIEEGDCGDDFLSRWKCVVKAVDDCGNESKLTFYLVIYDQTKPVFTYFPKDKTIDCSEYPEIEEPVATDNCSGVMLEMIEEKPDKGSCNYAIKRTWIATDGCGNSTSRTQTIYVEDNEAPVIIPSHPLIKDLKDGEEVVIDCEERSRIMTELDEFAIGRTDNCDRHMDVDYMIMTVNYAANCELAGYSDRMRSLWTATDDCGNSTTFEVIWKFVDTTPPVIRSVPKDACVSELPPVPDQVNAVDNCTSATLTFEESEPIACEDGGGTYVLRTWTATDKCGNVATASQKLIIDDGVGPQVTVDYPGFEAVADGGEAIVEAICTDDYEYGVPDLSEYVQITDNCIAGDRTTSMTLIAEGNCAEDGYLYLLELVVEASDLCGNITTYTVSVKVTDSEAPVISGPIETTVSCNDELPELTAEDACTDVVSLTVEDQNVVTDFCGHQSLERLWTATDACGNTSTLLQTVTIVDDEGPELIGVPDDVCDIVPEIPTVTAIDACTGAEAEVSFEETTEEGPCGQIIRRTWSATDVCGNTSTHTQSIYFNDTEPPVISFKDPALKRSAEGRLRLACIDYPEYSTELPTFGGADALELYDECTGDVDVSLDIELLSMGDCAVDGYLSRHLYTWTATDPCGNSSQLSLEITFIDNYAPILIGVPGDIKLNCEDKIPHVPTVTAIDDCSEPAVSMEETVEYFNGGYYILRTWTSEDACGNSRSETQKIKVYQSEISGAFGNLSPIVCGSEGNSLGFQPSGGKAPYSYFWEMVDCDGFITGGQTSKTITYTAGYTTLNFRVRVTDANGCVGIFQTSIGCIKEKNPDKIEIINVFGRNLLSSDENNPAETKLDLTEYTGLNTSFRILDTNGRPVRNLTFQPVPGAPVDFELEGLAPGVYQLQVNKQPISIFPNPTSTNAMIDLSAFSGEAGTLIIYDVHGKQAKVMEIDEVTENLIELKLEHFDSGLYNVTFRTKDGQIVNKKLIVQRP